MDQQSDNHEQLLAANAHVRTLARVLASPDATSDDIQQEAWLQALRSPTDEPIRNARSFWGTVVRRAASNLRRTEVRRQAREQEGATTGAGREPDGPFDLAVFEERRGELVGLVDSLPEAQRDVIVARYWQGLEPAEIARRNRERPETVRQRLKRAHDSLRERLDARSGGSSRAAWLGPLLGIDASGRTVVGAAGAIATTGWLMNKLVWTSVSIVALACGLWLWDVVFEQPTSPSKSSSSRQAARASLDERNGEREGGGSTSAGPERRLAVTEVEPELAVHARLLDAAGSPVVDVPYWFGERPIRGIEVSPPAGTSRTDAMGRFGLVAGPRAWLWLAIDDHLQVAVDLRELDDAGEVRLPPRRRATVEIVGLPTGEPWRILCYPVREQRDGRRSLVSSDLRKLVRPGQPTLWCVRHLQVVEGRRGDAWPSFPTLKAMAYCYAPTTVGYEIEPDRQYLVGASHVVAELGARRDVYEFAAFEADGLTAHTKALRAGFDEGGSAYGKVFLAGRGRLARDPGSDRTGVRVGCTLHDGEAFRFALSDLQVDEPVRLIRGQGRAPIARVSLAPEVAAWREPEVLFVANGRPRSVRDFGSFDAASDERDLGIWRHGDTYVVQTSIEPGLVGRMLLRHASGRFAVQRDATLQRMSDALLQPVRLADLVARYAAGTAANRVTIWHEVQLDDVPLDDRDPWIVSAVWRLRRFEGIGWRLAGRPLPETIERLAPVRSRSRLLVSVDGVDDLVELPLLPR